MAFTFVRTFELRFIEEEEIDWKRKEWKIPPERMKMRAPDIVPLSKQAQAVLRKLIELKGNSRYLCASATNANKPMSENTILFALYRMGYHSRMTGHGFGGLASTILNEHGFNRDWIERQLTHTERDSVRAAYNQAEYLKDRHKMMQWWADYLEQKGTIIAAKSNRV